MREKYLGFISKTCFVHSFKQKLRTKSDATFMACRKYSLWSAAEILLTTFICLVREVLLTYEALKENYVSFCQNDAACCYAFLQQFRKVALGDWKDASKEVWHQQDDWKHMFIMFFDI